jgi:hypothetical protein
MNLKSANHSRWLNWTPPTHGSDDTAETGPTKPSKPGFVGFDGTNSNGGSEIQPNQHLDLEALRISMERLEGTHISIAVSHDGTIRVAQGDIQVQELIKHGLTVYSPADMYHYVQLEPNERRMLRSFQKQFAGSIEWKA